MILYVHSNTRTTRIVNGFDNKRFLICRYDTILLLHSVLPKTTNNFPKCVELSYSCFFRKIACNNKEITQIFMCYVTKIALYSFHEVILTFYLQFAAGRSSSFTYINMSGGWLSSGLCSVMDLPTFQRYMLSSLSMQQVPLKHR
jgi:hypothetical protein